MITSYTVNIEGDTFSIIKNSFNRYIRMFFLWMIITCFFAYLLFTIIESYNSDTQLKMNIVICISLFYLLTIFFSLYRLFNDVDIRIVKQPYGFILNNKIIIKNGNYVLKLKKVVGLNIGNIWYNIVIGFENNKSVRIAYELEVSDATELICQLAGFLDVNYQQEDSFWG